MFVKRFHLMYQNLSILDLIICFKFFLKKKNVLLRRLFFKYGFKNVNIFFFDSGRNCLSFILEKIKLKNSKKNSMNEILVPSFTCEIVPIHVLKSNFKPIFYDLCPNTENVLKFIKKKINKNTKAIIYQHSFGKHDDISKLVHYCKLKNLLLIEDKALCFLSKKKNLYELQGDFAYYSFETSKTVSTRMGGMLICNKRNNFNIIYQNSLIQNFKSDLRTILSILTYKIPGYLGFGIRKILIFLKFLDKSINEKDLNIDRKFVPVYYDLTDFQKCLLIQQLKKINSSKKICKKNIKFWEKLLPDFKEENKDEYSLYYPVRLYYNGHLAKKIRNKIRKLGMIQDAWFEGGIGSKYFKASSIGFKIKNFKNTKLFCKNYVNLPTLINMESKFKKKIIEELYK